MTETDVVVVAADEKRKRKRRWCLIAVGAIAVLIFVLFIICLVLALTVFKPKQPTTELVSASIDGVAPRVSLPVLKIELNISLQLQLSVQNRNHASFRHGEGKSYLTYRGKQVGEADVYPGTIGANGNTTVACRLTVEVDELATEMEDLIRDVLGGELVMETRTTIPGRVTFLGIIKKHVVAISECQLTIAILQMKIRSQDCKYKTKL